MYFIASNEIKKIMETFGVNELNETDFYDAIDHGELVARLVQLLAESMKLEEPLRELLHNSAILHDIGKLRLSENIYGRDKQILQVEEERYMRMHANFGAEMLEHCGYERAVVEAVRHHHESYDGSGYPDNQTGLNIPYAARFIRVCDVFAALISDRPYRKAFTKEEAMEMMVADYKNLDMRIFLEFMKVYNSPEIDDIMDFAERINEKHSYAEFWTKTEGTTV